MKKCVMVILAFLFSLSIQAQNDIVGQWKTIDDNTGKERSVVEIFQKGNKYFGKIIKLNRDPGEDPSPVCNECDEADSRYKQPVIGMEILRDLEKDENEYDDGNILDPENGSIYRCKVWIEDGNLMLRGYIAFFYRTQKWIPVDGKN